MSARAPVKSILKQSPSRTSRATDEQKAQADKDRTNLNIALKHAYLIQHRKDVEASILDSLTLLIDYPAQSEYTGEEANNFIKLIQPFQPSDYDNLIEERNIDGRCGYALCANAPRSQTMGSSAAWKLKTGMSVWCSDHCARKGLHVKAQLSAVPAWERIPEQQPEILLHEDDRPPEDDTAARRANRARRINEWRDKVANVEELAMERGEKSTSFRPDQVMTESIVEKIPRPTNAREPEMPFGQANSIEGYQPKMPGNSKKLLPGDSDDDSDAND